MVKRYTHPVAGDLAKRMDAEPPASNAGPPPLPADVLRRHLPPRKTVEQAAAWFEIPTETLQGLIDGAVRIDVPLAIQLETLGPSAETWLNIQSAHDLWFRRHSPEPQPHVIEPEASATLMTGKS
jgi:plasmid maintenance system antidote protein VapI